MLVAALAVILTAPEAAALYQASPVFAPDDGEVEVIWRLRGSAPSVTLRLTSFDPTGYEVVLTEVDATNDQGEYRFIDRRPRGGRPTTYRLVSVNSEGDEELIGVVTCFDPTMSGSSSQLQSYASSGIATVSVVSATPTMPWALRRSNLRSDAGGPIPPPQSPVPRILRAI